VAVGGDFFADQVGYTFYFGQFGEDLGFAFDAFFRCEADKARGAGGAVIHLE
jgi:hypothetical protein